jgi:UDP-N-acetylmuramoylalanine-D-glutamate ligase
MSKEVERFIASLDGGFVEVVEARDYEALLAERDRLRDALEQAAQSLESISKLAGRDEFMQDVLDIRGFANSRATVARAALQGEQP